MVTKMATLTIRPYQGETDLQPIADLLNQCELVDREDNYYSVTGLQLEFTHPDCNPVRDLRLWCGTAGELIAFGQLWIPAASTGSTDALLWFRVHPAMRDRGLENEIIAWGETRTCEAAKERNLAAKMSVGCRDYQHDRITLFEKLGFTYERCFLHMSRSLVESIDQPQLPAGFTLISCTDSANIAAWVEMYNQTFVDHWNFHPRTIEQAEHCLNDPNYQPNMDLVAVAPDGTYAAFCYAHIDRDNNEQRGCREGWIDVLGTRRGFRRLGLGRTMLLAGLHRLQAAGMETALLGVDSQNPNQAYTLYESVGFGKQFANFSYAKWL